MATFDDILQQISRLESPEFLEDLAEQLSAEVERLVERGFATATDPYGNPWSPRKLAKRRRQPPNLPLQRTGALKAGFHVEHNAAGVKETNPVVYAGFIQDGTRVMDARAMLPNDKEGLGEWEEPLREVARQVFNAALNEVG